MLHVWRKIDATSLGCSVESHLLLAPTHRFVASATEGCRYLPTLLPPQPAPGRVYLYLVLAGEVKTAGDTGGPGTLFLSATRDDFYLRNGARPSASHRALGLQIDEGLVRPRQAWPRAVPASADLFAAGSALFAAIRDPDAAPSSLFSRGQSVLEQLADHLEIGALEWAEVEVTPMTDALRSVFSVTGTIPALGDMAARTGLSERTVRRLVRAATQQVGLPFSGWRTWRESWTVSVAALLLTASEGTPARVAEVVGYSDVPALYHAFKRAGLPPPSAVRDKALTSLQTLK